jgi:hypothetical protein
MHVGPPFGFDVFESAAGTSRATFLPASRYVASPQSTSPPSSHNSHSVGPPRSDGTAVSAYSPEWAMRAVTVSLFARFVSGAIQSAEWSPPFGFESLGSNPNPIGGPEQSFRCEMPASWCNASTIPASVGSGRRGLPSLPPVQRHRFAGRLRPVGFDDRPLRTGKSAEVARSNPQPD